LALFSLIKAIYQVITLLTMAPPRSSEKETILLTGASGYLAGHILKKLLEYGFSVRATVRNQAAENRVKSAISVKHHASLTFVIIPDLLVDGAFDEAVKDVNGVSSVQISIF
jgi:uncharacterized protein YbjT (DUF2867 family)